MSFPIQFNHSQQTWYGTTQQIFIEIQNTGDITIQSISQNIFQAIFSKIFKTNWLSTKQEKVEIDLATREKLGEGSLVNVEIQAIQGLLEKKKFSTAKTLSSEFAQKLPKMIHELAVSRLMSISIPDRAQEKEAEAPIVEAQKEIIETSKKDSQMLLDKTVESVVKNQTPLEQEVTVPSAPSSIKADSIGQTPKPAAESAPTLSEEEVSQQLKDLEREISLGNFEAVKKQIEALPFLVNLALTNGKPALHYAIETGKNQIAEFLIDFPETNLQLKDKSGTSAFDLCIHYENLDLADKIAHLLFDRFNLLIQSYTPPTLEISEEEKMRFNPDLLRQGYLGHNPLLTYAIAKNDPSLFVKAVIEGAEYKIVFKGRNLFEIAAETGRGEILLFLLTLIPYSEDFIETLKSAATSKKQPAIVKLLEEWEKNNASPKDSPLIAQHLSRLQAITNDYKKEKEGLSDSQKLQNKMNAVHGSTGHNQFLEFAIKSGDFKAFALLLKAEVPINTYAVRLDRIFQSQKGIFETLKESLEDVPRGVGQTLLHLAVTHNRVEMIYHLLEKGLNPYEPDEQGRTPLMIALKEGNMEAAFLMMKVAPETGKFSKDRVPMNPDALKEAVSLMIKGAELRDPLRITNQEKLAAAMATAFFLSQTAIFGTWGGYLSLVPVIVFAYKTVFGGSLEEEIPQKEVAHSPTFKAVDLFFAKGEILELLSPFASLPIFTTMATAMRTYKSGANALAFLADSYKEFLSRPQQVAFKGGVKVLSAAYNLALINRLMTGWMAAFNQATSAPSNLIPSEAADILGLTPEDLSSSNLSQIQHKAKKAYRQLALKYHPDKVPLDLQEIAAVQFQKINEAQELLNKVENIDELSKLRPSLLWDAASKVGETALKVGAVFGIDKASAFLGKNLWAVSQLTPLLILGKNLFWYSTSESGSSSAHPHSSTAEADISTAEAEEPDISTD